MDKVIEQFSKRAGTRSSSANRIADQSLIRAHINATEGKNGGSLLRGNRPAVRPSSFNEGLQREVNH